MKDVDHRRPPSSPTPSSSFFSTRTGLLSTAPAIAAIFFVFGYFLGISSSFPPALPSPSTSFSTNNMINTATSTTAQKVVADAADQQQQQKRPPPPDLLRFRTKCADPVPQSQHLQTVLSRVYNSTSPYEGFPSPETSSLLLPTARRLRGWGSTTAVFSDLVHAVRPLTVIELGTFLGASALHVASLTRNLSLPTLILCLDDFRGWPGFRARLRRDLPAPRHGDSLLLHQFMLHVADAGETARVIPMPFSTGSSLAALCEWGVYGDLIEVDAGHDFHSAWADINMAYAVLRPGGVLFGHDYFTVADDRGVRRAVNLFAKVNGLKVRPHGQHWVLSPKPSHH
ncbi:uncharacterized protein M6B38_310230 [Iris pallida]|uniref:Uncharacterized protein n=1 Tax=Iris pallida TaxID=29817 RepID=A0AAX6HIL2_IRIPA|nr:uncharacterized protein M6B38_310230 [Iris pallida]